MNNLRVIFAGTPVFAQAHLQAILDSHHQVTAVYTQPDRRSGRGQKLTPSPVKALAQAYDIPVFQPQSLKDEAAQHALAALQADIMVVVAYGLLLPQAVLDIPRLGCINVHGSLLPRWRGAAPIQRAIQAGDSQTGVTIMQMNAGLDTGDMLLKARCPILATDSTGELHDRLIETGRPALIQALDALADERIQPEAQDDRLACYAHKLSKEEARLDWTQPATVLARHVRAFNPWPVATTTMDDQVIRVWQATALAQDTDLPPATLIGADRTGLDIACGQGILRITQAQLPGSRAMPIQDLLNSRKSLFFAGKQFS